MRDERPATPKELAQADAAILEAAERWERMMWTRDSPAARVEAEAALLEAFAQRRELRGRGRVMD